MTEKLNTKWFKLENYDAFKKMSTLEWYMQLQARAYFYNSEEEELGWVLPAIAVGIKKGALEPDMLLDLGCYEEMVGIDKNQLFATPTIKSLTNYQAWNMAKFDHRLTDKAKAFHAIRDEFMRPWEEGDEPHDNAILEAAHAPYDLHQSQYLGWDGSQAIAHVTVDLNAPDEQIEIDFSNWLMQYRNHTSHYVPNKKAHEVIFTQKVFDTWISNQLIPYLDIVLIAKIEGKKVSQADIGELIFPDKGHTEIDHKISLDIKPPAEALLTKENLSSLLNQSWATKRQNTNRYPYKK